MVKLSSLLVIIFLICGKTASAQFQEKESFPRNFVQLSPFHLPFFTFQLSYERILSKNYSAGFFISPGAILRYRQDETRAGLNLLTQLRFYLNENRIDHAGKNFYGFYTAPFFRYRYLEINRNEFEHFAGGASMVSKRTMINTYGGGLVIGFQTCIMKVAVLDLFMGGGVQYSAIGSRYPGYYNDFDIGMLGPGYSGVFPTMGLRLGFAF